MTTKGLYVSLVTLLPAQDLKAASAAAAAGKGKGKSARAQAEAPGEAMRAAGPALVGRHVLRFWPDSGGWWEAVVDGWDAASAQHRLVYDAGSLQVSLGTMVKSLGQNKSCLICSVVVFLVVQPLVQPLSHPISQYAL